jgi:C-terminal processing protease CtpA/Prc
MGMGLGGPIEGYIGRVDNIIMEDFKFDNVITHYQKLDSSKLNIDESDKHGIMGNALISHFNVALDFSNQKLYLKKNSTSNKKMDVDRSGLFIIATGTNLDEYVVKDVIKGSAAEDAGILPGDIIHRFNGLTIRIFTLSDLNSRLSSSRKKKIKMILIRDGVKMKKTIYLRDVI